MAHPPKNRLTGKKVYFMMTCLCDAIFADAAKNAVKVLEKCGCQVIVPDAQTCCGQPAFNCGDWKNARKVLNHTMSVFKEEIPIIVPSASCAAMLYHGAPLAFKDVPEDLPKAKALASRSWEFCDFIVNGLGVNEWKGTFNAKIALHASCHSKGSGTMQSIDTLFAKIDGLEILDFPQSDECCGFGGTFSVNFPELSAKLGENKVKNVSSVNPDYVVAPDTSCLLHQQNRANKLGIKNYNIMHIASLLAKAANL